MDKFGEVSIPVQALLESVLKNYSINAEDLYFKCKQNPKTIEARL